MAMDPKERLRLIREEIIQGHIYDVVNWSLRDQESLEHWLRATLHLEDLSEDELIEEYGCYLSIDEDEVCEDPEGGHTEV